MAAGCNVDLQTENGQTPLHLAAGGGHAAVTKQLIAARCSVDLQEKNGWATALLYAARQGHAAVTEQLIAAGCNVNLQMKDGRSPLHEAAYSGHEVVTTQLLAARCNVDIQTKKVLSALQLAERQGHAGIATLIRKEKQETPLLGRRVVIEKPELNGRTGTAVSFDDDKGHYSVELDDTSSLMIKPCNLLPTQGCSVALCSLLCSQCRQLQGSLDVLVLLQASPEKKTKKQQEDADRAMKELLEEAALKDEVEVEEERVKAEEKERMIQEEERMHLRPDGVLDLHSRHLLRLS